MTQSKVPDSCPCHLGTLPALGASDIAEQVWQGGGSSPVCPKLLSRHPGTLYLSGCREPSEVDRPGVDDECENLRAGSRRGDRKTHRKGWLARTF